MIPKECKRLAEVDFPIAEVSKHAAREKSIRHGHPSTLHLWWARRPLASSRAVLIALLLPDPCDAHCPEGFKSQAREILGEVRQPPKSDEDLQNALLWFIGSFANWDMSSNRVYLKVARTLVRAAHPEETPLVVDPFSGGGSIPLEALRLGCDVFASDLNPVAYMILKVMLEDIPRHGPELGEELRRVGGEIKATAKKELADFYPADSDGATPIAYLWARTVRCESPKCGAEIPLLRSLWLCNKAKHKWALRAKVVRPKGDPPRVDFEIFEPTNDKEVADGTVARSNAKCPVCGVVVPRVRVQPQMIAMHGGADHARLIAVVARGADGSRKYRLPNVNDFDAIVRAEKRLVSLVREDEDRYQITEELPYLRSIFNVNIYGIDSWGRLFTTRQRLALLLFCDIVRDHINALEKSDELTGKLLAITLSRMSDYMSSICRWDLGQERAINTFCRQALGMVWDFAEIVPYAHTVGSWESMLNSVIRVIERGILDLPTRPTVVLSSAVDLPLPDESSNVVFTDPPYYDAVPYSNLSDFFIVWLRRALGNHGLKGLEDGLSPKSKEIVQLSERNPRYAHKTKAFFEEQMALAFKRCKETQREDGVCCVVFAHKETDSWEALLGALVGSGWRVIASWPIQTEQAQRLRARNSAALGGSVHLICRPRPEDAPVGDWADVLRELPVRVTAWIERLQGEGIRGADLVFACIGPALEIFSRYRAVETAEGREVGLPEYLEKVWEVVGRAALEQVLGSGETSTGALEEDARLTALFLWTIQSTEPPEENGKKEEEDDEVVAKVAAKGFSLPYDVVRRFAQPMGIDLAVWTGRVIGQDKGVVRLLPVAERSKALFGEDGARTAAEWIESDPGADLQGVLFPEMDAAPKKKSRGRVKNAIIGADAEIQSPDATTLDRIHAAMLLQASGQANALRKLLGTEQDRGPDFLRFANALSALYPKGAEEKRLLDAILLAVPR